jgi:murein DD-endopeptidase MepM/ murein hydrolase activator NlpD
MRHRLLAVLFLSPSTLAGQLAERPLLIEARVPKPPTLASGGDGSFLVYEVHLTNFEPHELTWTGLEASDAASGAVLFSMSDSALAREMARPGVTGSRIAAANRPRLYGGERAVVFVYHVLAAGQRPAALRHRLTVVDSVGTRTLVMRDVPVIAEAAALGPPLKGGNWLAGNGPARASGHRRALIPIDGVPSIAQRFAIDYVIVDSAGSTHRGDRSRNDSYYAEGEDAIAVADGIVVATKDSIPENVPGPTSRAVPITLETVGGNHVILDIGGGRYAFYAHLKPGSLRVKRGDRVRRGQTLGLVGNSGNSTEPHLHFHVSDGTSPLGSEGLPYEFETLEVVGRCQSVAGGCSTASAQTRRRVMPLQNEIVRFPR